MNLPNQLTVARLGMCVLFVAVLEVEGRWRGVTAALLFGLAALTDWLDGALARRWDLVTNLGKLLDPLADKILVSVAYLVLVREDLAPLWIVAAIISREFLITGLRTLAAANGLILSAEKIGKHKTISQMVTVSLGLVLLAMTDLQVGPEIVEFLRERILQPLLWITVVITVFSGIAYFMKNRNLVL